MKYRLLVLFAAAAVLLGLVSLATARTLSRPGVAGVSFSCLDSKQRAFVIAQLARGRAGAAVFRSGSVKASCVLSEDRASRMAPCGLGDSPFVPGCVLTALKGKHYGGGDLISIINPDSMRPEDLVGANPTPHP